MIPERRTLAIWLKGGPVDVADQFTAVVRIRTYCVYACDYAFNFHITKFN